MRRSSFFKAISLGITATMLLVGCSNSTSTTQSVVEEEAIVADVSEESEYSGEVVELRFHDIIPSTEREEKFKEMIDRFNEQTPNIHVTYESTPWDQSHNKMITQGAADTLPDISIMHVSWMTEFANAGWAIPLDDYVDSWEYGDSFIPYAKNVLIEYDQKNVLGYTIGIPDGLTTHGMYVRTDWLEEVGLTVEDLETWEGIFEASELMTDVSKDQYGFAFRGSRGGADQLGMYLLGALEGKLYEEDGTCRINTPEGLEAFETYANIYLGGQAPQDSINWGYAEMVQGFTSGLSGILNQTTEVTAICEESMEDGTWTVIPFPRSADGNIYSKADSFLYIITSSCEYPDEAWEFLSFMMEPENNMEYCETNLYIPVMQGAETNPIFTEGAMEGFVESMNDDNFVRNPYYGYFAEVTEFSETVYDSELQKYLLGQQTAQETVDNIANFLTEAQQAYMAEDENAVIPRAVKADGTELK